MTRKTNTITVRAYWELKDGSFRSWDAVRTDPELQSRLVNKRAFKSAIAKMKRAGIIQEI